MKNSRHSVFIEKIVSGGLGLARLADGRIVFVKNVLPGEKVIISVREEKKHYLQAEIAAIEEAHPARIDPPCPWYGPCGGCDLQHSGYEQQLSIKTAIVQDLFYRQFSKGPSVPSAVLQAIRPSPASFGYRQRIRLQVDKSGMPGFMGARSHKVVAIGHCLVARDELNSALAELRQHPSGVRILTKSREVELLLNPITSKVVCLFHYLRKPRPADILQAEDLVKTGTFIENAFFRGDGFSLVGPIGGAVETTGGVLQMLLPPTQKNGSPILLGWEVGGFCQVNLEQNERLVRHVVSLCNLQENESVLDLFCGMGNFSIPLAMHARFLVGLEGQGSAIRSAKKNSERAGVTNTDFQKAVVHDACRRLASEGKIFDCVVLDPPRQGVPGLAAELAGLTRRRMLYISCDPATLCRDLEALVQHGLQIVHVQPFDMFPQTHHIEAVALLEKN